MAHTIVRYFCCEHGGCLIVPLMGLQYSHIPSLLIFRLLPPFSLPPFLLSPLPLPPLSLLHVPSPACSLRCSLPPLEILWVSGRKETSLPSISGGGEGGGRGGEGGGRRERRRERRGRRERRRGRRERRRGRRERRGGRRERGRGKGGKAERYDK